MPGKSAQHPRAGNVTNAAASKGWLALVALATAQFLMVLDQSVMNVSIGALVHDFHTTVTTIQAVITLYCLVMAMLILTGAKIGDMIGRRRAFVIGLIIYACGFSLGFTRELPHERPAPRTKRDPAAAPT